MGKVRRSSSAPHELTISAHAVDSGATGVAVDAGEALESTEAANAEDKNRKCRKRGMRMMAQNETIIQAKGMVFERRRE